MRNGFVVFGLQVFHRIVQEEVNEDSVDPVGLFWRFGVFWAFFGVLGVVIFRGLPCRVRFVLLRGLAVPIHLGCRVSFFDLAFDQLHTPDTRASQLDLPRGAWGKRLSRSDVTLQRGKETQTAQLVQHLGDAVV